VAAIFDYKLAPHQGQQEIILDVKTLASDRISLMAKLISHEDVIILKEY
jgi:hypothetical protein